MEYRVRITYDGELTEEFGDRLLDDLLRRAPGWGPTLSADPAERTFAVTVALEAGTLVSALASAIVPASLAVATVDLPRDESETAVRASSAEVELVRARAPASSSTK